MIYIVEVKRDPKTGEIILPLPTKLVDAMKWSVGDQLSWGETLILEKGGKYEGLSIRRVSDEKNDLKKRGGLG
jgi:hypothetical protein